MKERFTLKNIGIGFGAVLVGGSILVIAYSIAGLSTESTPQTVVHSDSDNDKSAEQLLNETLGGTGSVFGEGTVSLPPVTTVENASQQQQSTEAQQQAEGSTLQQQPAASSGIPTQTLENGIVIEQHQLGEGDRSSVVGDVIGVQYIGYFETGDIFDTSLKAEQKPFVFELGAGSVIQGWDIALQDMKVNEIRRIYIPSDLAYGEFGSPPSIPPNTNLIFDVFLVGFGQ